MIGWGSRAFPGLSRCYGGRSGTPERIGGVRFSEFHYLVRSDLYRHDGASGFGAFLRNWWGNPGFKCAFYFRLCAYLQQHPLLRYGVFHVVSLWSGRSAIRYGVSIPVRTRIGSGLYIGHYGGIFVNGDTVIGRNCNISEGVVIGEGGRGDGRGSPVIGDNVFLGSGAKVIGPIRVGDHVAVGANCVVTKDVPERGVVVGVPGNVISQAGSDDFVEFTDY